MLIGTVTDRSNLVREIEENVRKSGNILEYSLAFFLGMGMDSLFNKRQQSNNITQVPGMSPVVRWRRAVGFGVGRRILWTVRNIVLVEYELMVISCQTS